MAFSHQARVLYQPIYQIPGIILYFILLASSAYPSNSFRNILSSRNVLITVTIIAIALGIRENSEPIINESERLAKIMAT